MGPACVGEKGEQRSPGPGRPGPCPSGGRGSRPTRGAGGEAVGALCANWTPQARGPGLAGWTRPPGQGMFCVCRAAPWTGQGPVDLLPGRSKLPGPSQAHSSPLLPRGRGPDLGPRGWAATPSELTWVSWDRRGLASLVCDALPPRGGCPVRPAGASGGDVSAPDLPRFPPSRPGIAQGRLLLPSNSELPDQCYPDPCDKGGTQVCQDLMGTFYCQCRDGWAGRLCNRGKATAWGRAWA